MKIHPILTKCGKYFGKYLPTEKFSGNEDTEIHLYLQVCYGMSCILVYNSELLDT